MKFWLNIPCSELSREWLLDEHRSIHAYFGGMLKNPDKWASHILIGPMDAYLMYLRHEEEICEIARRGYKHSTPISVEDMNKVQSYRTEKLGLGYGKMLKNEQIVVVEEMKQLQMEYAKLKNVSLD